MRTTEAKILYFAEERWGKKTLEGLAVKLNEGRSTFGDLADEVGDVLIVASQFAAKLGTTLEQLRARRFEKIEQRAIPEEKEPVEGAEKEEQGAVVSTRCFACGCVTPGVYHCVRGRFYCSSCYHGLPENYGKPTQITPL